MDKEQLIHKLIEDFRVAQADGVLIDFIDDNVYEDRLMRTILDSIEEVADIIFIKEEQMWST